MILRYEIAELIEPHIAEDDWGEGLHLTLADRILAIPGLDPTPLHMRVLAMLGRLRDDMPPEDVAAVQRFVDWFRPETPEEYMARPHYLEELRPNLGHTKPWQVTGDEPSLATRDKD